ncbi:hypothetical protein QUF58_11605 [Anaerolineales bacterium HSG24]|nr:hypothetical protein [Anaerolineales bacterium HSG24]
MAKTKKKKNDDQYDSPWKKAIEEYFADCMAFFFPNIHADIDWSKKYEFWDKELEKLARESAVHEQQVDKLVQVYRKSGEETLVLVHIDVQSQHETEFAKRMYQYNYRLFDRYNHPVATLVIYGDQSKKWQPKTFNREIWGCKSSFEFPSVKLMDYNISELEQSDNPFAVVVLAHRHTKATKHQHQTRYDLRWRLTRMLYERGYDQERVRSLYLYIEWLMALPKGLEQQFNKQLLQYEEEQKMTYILTIERMGIEKGIQQGIQQSEQKVLESEQKVLESEQKVLEITKESEQKILESEQKVLRIAREDVIEVLMIRFGELPKLLVKTIKRLDQLSLLKTLHKKAVIIESVDLFEQFLADQLPDDDTPTAQDKKHVD